MIDEHDAASGTTGEIGACDDAKRPVRGIHHDGLPMPRREQVLGGLGEQSVRRDEHDIAVHHFGDTVRERDETSSGVRVVPGQKHGRSPLVRQGEDGVRRRGTPRDDKAAHARLKRHRLGAHAVAHDERVARPDVAKHRVRFHRSDEQTTRELSRRIAGEQLGLEHIRKVADGDRQLAEAAKLGLVDIALGQREHGHESHDLARLIEHRESANARVSHQPARIEQRPSSVMLTTSSVMTSRARARTWAIRSGSSTPNRENAHAVSGGTGPRRAGT